ncbi:FAD-dependent oxidoreductase [Candidatus Poribacteria bacterium]|nr:FAD-dependent oxidoreductase [Candidatus Poribacteria bacterium]
MENYDIAVIGGGSAGLVLAIAGVKLGKRTILIEKHRIGGDCLWTGCVPSKALLKVAKVATYIKHSNHYGIDCVEHSHEWQKVKKYIQDAQHTIEEEHDNPERFREMGIEVVFGNGSFQNSQTFIVEDTESGNTREIQSKKFVITTGSRPLTPDISGIDSCDYLDSENVWEVEELPKRLLVVGAGPIGIELGQAFHRLGSQVTILQRGNSILKKEDSDVSEKMLEYLESEGIEFKLNSTISEIRRQESEYCVSIKDSQSSNDTNDGIHAFDQVLIAAGRKPNIEGLKLEEIGVQVNKKGIVVNQKLQTHVKNIYAAGDVIGEYLFTHVAAYQAQLLVRNFLLPWSQKIDYSVVPWTTFSDPEVARCGLTEEEAREKHGDVDVFILPQTDVDRAVADGETKGFTKVITSKWLGKILGVHIVGTSAGEVIHEYVLAMHQGIPLRKLSGMMHVYPTYSTSTWRIAAKWISEGSLVNTLRKTFGK